MRQRNRKRRIPAHSGRAALIGSVAVLAFMLLILREVLHLRQFINDLLVDAGAIFQTQISVAAILATLLVGVFFFGIIFFHADEFKKHGRAVSRAVTPAYPIARQLISAIFIVVASSLVFIRFGAEEHVSRKQQTSVAAPIQHKPDRPASTVLGEISEIAPVEDASSLAKIVPPEKLRMAGRDVCDLFEDATEPEQKACSEYLKKHPTLTGGAEYVPIEAGDRLELHRVPWPPLPRPRPPLNIVPERSSR